MSESDVVSSQQYCQYRGIDPIPPTELERLSAIFEYEFGAHQRNRNALSMRFPWMALGAVIGLIAFETLKPWMPFAGA